MVIEQARRGCRCERFGEGIAEIVIGEMEPWKAGCKNRYRADTFDVTYSSSPELSQPLACLGDTLEQLRAHLDLTTFRLTAVSILSSIAADVFNTGARFGHRTERPRECLGVCGVTQIPAVRHAVRASAAASAPL